MKIEKVIDGWLKKYKEEFLDFEVQSNFNYPEQAKLMKAIIIHIHLDWLRNALEDVKNKTLDVKKK